MRIAISQPTYLPWLGYFDLIDQVDLFVVLDNVQFEKQSWQQRNRIRTAAGLQWLTVPVKFRGRLGQLIREVEIREPEFWRDHIRAIELAYRRSSFFDRYFEGLSSVIRESSTGLLLDLNLNLLRWTLDHLAIKTPVLMASSLGVSGKRTHLLAAICSSVGATEYVSPLGSAAYLLEEESVLQDSGVGVAFQNYQHPVYRQLHAPFQPFASAIDLLFNEGDTSLEIIRSGRRPPYSSDELAALAHTG